MKRKLIRQMLREWKANIWLIVELVIVLLIIQFIFAALCSFYSLHSYSTGQKLDDIYVSNLEWLQEKSEGYTPYDSIHTWQSDLDMLVTQLRSNPYVEHVAMGNFNSLPYAYNFYGNEFCYKSSDGKGDQTFTVNIREMSPEMMEVLQIHGLNGETPAQMAEILRKGEIVLGEIETSFFPESPDIRQIRGKEVYAKYDSLTSYHVGAVAKGLRRNDYEPLWNSTLFKNIDIDNVHNITVRVKPGAGNKFLESLSDKDKQARNLYLSQMVSLDNLRNTVHLDINNEIRNYVICALFLMLVIFLGFLGTFWFRTQQRVPEIAIRKVNGATNGNIYSRFFSEGFILLATSAVIALPLTVWMIKSDLISQLGIMSLNKTTTITGSLLAVGVMSLMILGGIFAPARRATRVDPAEALKDM